MAKSKERTKAILLRKEGESIKVIARKLNVSIGSVSSWCKSVELTNEQKIKLSQRVTDPYYGKKRDYLEKKQKEFRDKVLRLKNQGIQEIGKLSKREIFLIGIALYWGEGFKRDHQVGFANIDQGMIKFFIFWLKTCFAITSKDLIIRVTANESYRNKINKLEQYWSGQLDIPLTQFSKPFFQKTIWKKQYDDDNYHGVLRIKVRKSVDLLRKIYGYIEGINLNIG